MDIRLALQTGIDLPIPELGISIHQPSFKEISYIGEEDFFVALQTFCLDKNNYIKDKNLLASTTNFQIFTTVIMEPQNKEVKDNVYNLLTLVFPEFKIYLTPQTIILRNQVDENIMIDQNNFEILQTIVSKMFCLQTSFLGSQGQFNPADEKAREIAEKIMAGRKKVALEKGNENTNIFSKYISILTIGVPSMSYEDCINLTVYQMYDLIERFGLYTSWDIDIKVRLAGGSPNGTPDDWMKNLH